MSKYKMRELPMRRGLSPEGREIRARHQGSLVIGSSTFAATVAPSFYKPLERERSLEGSVSQMRRLMTGRQHDGEGAHLLPSQQHPLRATHPPCTAGTGSLSATTTLATATEAIQNDSVAPDDGFGSSRGVARPPSEATIKPRDRDGSAHSDYFSLSEEQLHITDEERRLVEEGSAGVMRGSRGLNDIQRLPNDQDFGNATSKARGRVGGLDDLAYPSGHGARSGDTTGGYNESGSGSSAHNRHENCVGTKVSSDSSYSSKSLSRRGSLDHEENNTLSENVNITNLQDQYRLETHHTRINHSQNINNHTEENRSSEHLDIISNNIRSRSSSFSGDFRRGSEGRQDVQFAEKEAFEIIGQNIDRRKQIEKHKNQELSSDNPLLLCREDHSHPIDYSRDYNKPFQPKKDLGSTYTRVQPVRDTVGGILTNNNQYLDRLRSVTTEISQSKKRDGGENEQARDSIQSSDFSSVRRDGLRPSHKNNTSISQLNRLAKQRDSMSTILSGSEPEYIKRKSQYSSSSQSKFDLVENNVDRTDIDAVVCQPTGAWNKLPSSHTKLRRGQMSPARFSPVRVPNENVSKGVLSGDAEIKHVGLGNTYSLSSVKGKIENDEYPANRDNRLRIDPSSREVLSNIDNERLQSPRAHSAEAINTLHKENDKPKSEAMHSPKSLPSRNGASNVLYRSPMGGSPSSISDNSVNVPKPVRMTNYDVSRPLFGPESTVRNRLSLDGDFPTDSLLTKLQSGASTKLMPATLPKPTDFTRSLRSNATTNPKSISSQSKPMKASAMPKDIFAVSDPTTSLISEELRSNKVSDILAKIKKTKPTCDVNYKNVKKSIERQHVSLFGKSAGGVVGSSQGSSVVGSRGPGSVRSDALSTARSGTGSVMTVRSAATKIIRSRSVDRLIKNPHVKDSNQVDSNRDKNTKLKTVVKTALAGPAVIRKESANQNYDSSKIKQLVQPKSVRSNMFRSSSNINISEESRSSAVQRISHEVPPINLCDLSQTSMDDAPKPLLDSLPCPNFDHSVDHPSADDIRLPLRNLNEINDQTTSSVANDNTKNTLELNIGSSTGDQQFSKKSDFKKRSVNTEMTSLTICKSMHSSDNIRQLTTNADSAVDLTIQHHLDRIVEVSSESGRTQSTARDTQSVTDSGRISFLGPNIEPCETPTADDRKDGGDYATSTPRVDVGQQQFDPATRLQEMVHVSSVGAAETEGGSHCSRRAAVQRNTREGKEEIKPRSKSGEPPPTYKRGQVPKYLQARRAEAAQRAAVEASRDPACPPNHTPLPQQQRLNTLRLLRHSVDEVQQQLGRLPVAQDSLRSRRHRQELEDKLQQLEEGIKIFSQPTVYVLHDEDEDALRE